MEIKDFELIKKILTIKGELENYVILCEDEQGRYVKYAFTDGEPHDSRCLSWYDKLQPTALERSGHDIDKWRLHEVGKIYRIHSFSCGNESLEGDEHCSPGHPKKACLKCQAKKWTYNEPVKCACWYLEETNFESMTFRLTFGQIKELMISSFVDGIKS